MQRGRVTGARSDGESLDSLGLEPGSLVLKPQYFYLMVTAFAGRLVSWGPEGEVEGWVRERSCVVGAAGGVELGLTGLLLAEGWAGRILEAKNTVQPGDWSGISSYFLSFYSGSGNVLYA